MSKYNVVDHPKHYEASCSIECIDAMELAYGKGALFHFCICNAFKYIWRYKHKNGTEDLNKANWYINKAKGYDMDWFDKIESLESLLKVHMDAFPITKKQNGYICGLCNIIGLDHRELPHFISDIPDAHDLTESQASDVIGKLIVLRDYVKL